MEFRIYFLFYFILCCSQWNTPAQASIGSILKNVSQSVGEKIEEGVSSVTDKVKSIGTTVAGIGSEVIETTTEICEIVSEGISKIKEGAENNNGNKCKTTGSEKKESHGILSGVKGAAKSVVGAVGEAVVEAASEVKETGDKLKDKAAKALEIPGKCYDEYELGCFPNGLPWTFLPLRPLPEPKSPDFIDVKLYLYTRNSPERYYVTLHPNISLNKSDFDPSRPYTAFINHGFSSSGNVSWVADLKDAYLEKRDANVFIVDWGKGASSFNYLQVAANTRIAGAEMQRFGKWLVEKYALNTSNIHLMGHSLGAHILAYMAKTVKGIGRISAFDPAQPGFEFCQNDVRLTKDDADFVDVIHTNIRPVIPLLGFGLILPTGHVDFYMNGGLIQPGCVAPPHEDINITSIMDLAKYPVEVINNWVACSHGKSYLYFTEAVKSDTCTFWGRSAGIVGAALDLLTVGRAEIVADKINKCTLEKCSPIGLETPDYPARGVFAATTHANSPFCGGDSTKTEEMRSLRDGTSETTTSKGGIITGVLSKAKSMAKSVF